MADRSSGNISIYGTIANLDQLEQLLDAVEEQNCGLNYDDSSDREDILLEILDRAEDGKPLVFGDTELAGGELELLDAYCRQHELPFVAQWDACGGAYDAGIHSCHPTLGEFSAPYEEGCGTLVPLRSLIAAHSTETIPTLIETYKRAQGDDFPPFAISEGVRAFIEEELNTDA